MTHVQKAADPVRAVLTPRDAAWPAQLDLFAQPAAQSRVVQCAVGADYVRADVRVGDVTYLGVGLIQRDVVRSVRHLERRWLRRATQWQLVTLDGAVRWETVMVPTAEMEILRCDLPAVSP